jgi:hypothetical protein
MNEEKKVQTTVKLDSTIHTGLKILCAMKGQAMKYVIENIIKDWVEKNREKKG